MPIYHTSKTSVNVRTMFLWISLAMASATGLAGSTDTVASCFSLTELMALTVFGGVRDGASSVQKLAALATSSMCATEVNSASVLDAALSLSTQLLPSLPINLLVGVSRFGSTRALELKSTLSV